MSEVNLHEARLHRQDMQIQKLMEEQDRLNGRVADWERKIVERDWDEIKIEQSLFERLKTRVWVIADTEDVHYNG